MSDPANPAPTTLAAKARALANTKEVWRQKKGGEDIPPVDANKPASASAPAAADAAPVEQKSPASSAPHSAASSRSSSRPAKKNHPAKGGNHAANSVKGKGKPKPAARDEGKRPETPKPEGKEKATAPNIAPVKTQAAQPAQNQHAGLAQERKTSMREALYRACALWSDVDKPCVGLMGATPNLVDFDAHPNVKFRVYQVLYTPAQIEINRKWERWVTSNPELAERVELWKGAPAPGMGIDAPNVLIICHIYIKASQMLPIARLFKATLVVRHRFPGVKGNIGGEMAYVARPNGRVSIAVKGGVSATHPTMAWLDFPDFVWSDGEYLIASEFRALQHTVITSILHPDDYAGTVTHTDSKDDFKRLDNYHASGSQFDVMSKENDTATEHGVSWPVLKCGDAYIVELEERCMAFPQQLIDELQANHPSSHLSATDLYQRLWAHAKNWLYRERAAGRHNDLSYDVLPVAVSHVLVQTAKAQTPAFAIMRDNLEARETLQEAREEVNQTIQWFEYVEEYLHRAWGTVKGFIRSNWKDIALTGVVCYAGWRLVQGRARLLSLSSALLDNARTLTAELTRAPIPWLNLVGPLQSLFSFAGNPIGGVFLDAGWEELVLSAASAVVGPGPARMLFGAAEFVAYVAAGVPWHKRVAPFIFHQVNTGSTFLGRVACHTVYNLLSGPDHAASLSAAMAALDVSPERKAEEKLHYLNHRPCELETSYPAGDRIVYIPYGRKTYLRVQGNVVIQSVDSGLQPSTDLLPSARLTLPTMAGKDLRYRARLTGHMVTMRPPLMMSASPHNVSVSMTTRALANGPTPDPELLDAFYDWALGCFPATFREIEDVQVMQWQAFVNGFEGSKRGQYQQALQMLVAEGVRWDDPKLRITDFFIKREFYSPAKMELSGLINIKPRMIQSHDRRHQIITGSWWKPFASFLERAWDATWPIYFTQRSTAAAVGEAFYPYFDQRERYYFYECDFSRYDSTQGPRLRETMIRLAAICGMPSKVLELELASISKRAYAADGASFTVEGTMASGASCTLVANSMLTASVLTFAYLISTDKTLGDLLPPSRLPHEHTALPFKLFVVGDDSVLVSRVPLDTTSFTGVVQQLGMLLEIEHRSNVYDVEYCSHLFMPVGTHGKLVPDQVDERSPLIRLPGYNLRTTSVTLSRKAGRALARGAWQITNDIKAKPCHTEHALANLESLAREESHNPILYVFACEALQAFVNDQNPNWPRYMAWWSAQRSELPHSYKAAVERIRAQTWRQHAASEGLLPCRETYAFLEHRYGWNQHTFDQFGAALTHLGPPPSFFWFDPLNAVVDADYGL